MKVTKINSEGLELIKSFEGLKLKPYLCQAKIPTIGYGTTIYPDGKRVTINDPVIDEVKAEMYLVNDISFFEKQVDSFTTDLVNSNQFSALVSFAYNLGANALKGSTLLRLVNVNHKDPKIRNEFRKWVNAGGRVSDGLVRRRTAEADLYFKA